MHKLPLLAILLVPLLLSACAGPSSKVVLGPGGQEVAQIDCNRDPSFCFEEAGEVCQGDTYQVVNSWSNAGGTLADIIPGPVTWYHMNIVCGPSDGAMPEFPFRGQSYEAPSVTNCQVYGNNATCTTY